MLETIETEIVDEEFNAPVLKSAKELSTLVNVDTLVAEYKDLSEIDINLPVEVIAENFLSIEKGFKAFRKARTSIEAKRKEIGEPAFKFHKKVIEIAKDVQNIINPYENKLKALVDKVENEENRKQEAFEQAERERRDVIRAKIEVIKNLPLDHYNSTAEELIKVLESLRTITAVENEENRKQEAFEQAERERRDVIRAKIEVIKNLPLDHYNSTAEELIKVLESLRTITAEEYEEFFDDAKLIQDTTISQLQNAREQKVKAEEADKILAEQAQRQAEAEELRQVEMNKEREAMDAERAEMQREREAFARQQQEHQEAIDLKNAEIENDRIAKEQEEARLKQEQFDADEKKRIDEEKEAQEKLNAERMQDEFESTITMMESFSSMTELLHAICDGEVKNLKWDV